MYIFIKNENFSKILKGNWRSSKVTFIINNLFSKEILIANIYMVES